MARTQIGLGEIGGNNRGPHVERWTRRHRAAWCAGFLSWCLEEARPGKFGFRSLGARRLCLNLQELPGVREVEHLNEPLAIGDCVFWLRGPSGGWQRHCGIVSWQRHCGIVSAHGGMSTDFDCIEGNVGRYPARVQQLRHDIWESKLWRVLRLP